MRVLTTLLLAAATTTAFGCGDDGASPAVERNNPGTGTRSFRVMAEIEGQDVSGGFVTAMQVELRDAMGQPISGATVVVRNDAIGTVNLLELSAGSGDYRATVNTFGSGDYRLDVTRGTDNVRGVIVGGMSAHVITRPSASSVNVANQPMIVEWTRPSEAAGVDIETRDFEIEGIADLGAYTIPAVDNPDRSDQRIRVWRYNEVNIAGGLFGSRLKLSIRNTRDQVVVQ